MNPLTRSETRIWRRLFGLLAIGLLVATTWGQSFQASLSRPALDRWMYPFNATPGTRPAASVFGTLGDGSGVDSRHGQFLLKFDLGGVAVPGRGPDRYLVKSARLSLVVSRDKAYPLDPTEDPMASYLEPDAPGYVADQDPARPVEVFGVGFRNGFTAETFLEDSPFGSSAAGRRNAYAAGPNPEGLWVDVGNSVGKTNEVFPVFDTRPLALGQVEGWPPGEPVPAGQVMTFDLDLENPWVAGYVQMALHTGRLWLAVTSLHESGFGGSPTFAEFYTQDSALGVPPSLSIEGTLIRDEDTDRDGLPDDWERFYWGDLSAQAGGDDDGDGITHEVEYRTGTSPRNAVDALRVMAVREAHGGFRLEFGHQPNSRYRIQSLSDGGQWVEVTDGSFHHDLRRGRVVWKEASSGVSGSRRSHRWYRVLVERDDGRGIGGGL